MVDWIAQGIGIVAAALTIFSFQCKSNKTLYIFQAVAGFLFFVNFFMLGDYTAAFLNLINLLRGGLLAGGKRFESRMYAAGLMALYTATTVVTFALFTNWFSILVWAAQLVGTVAMWSKKGKIIRLGQLFVVSPAWLINNIFNSFSIGGIITEAVSILSIIISLIRYRKGFETAD